MSEKESESAEENGDLPTSVLERLANDGRRNDLLLKEIRSHVEKKSLV